MILGIGDTGSGKYSWSKNQLVYKCWKSMLVRCYTDNYPSYHGCAVCDDWLNLDKFGEWFEENYIEGYHLDKDIINPGNKVYSPENCCFVPRSLNSLLTFNQSRGDRKTGVAKKPNGRYIAQVKFNNKNTHIGVFDTEHEASVAYAKKKAEIITEQAKLQSDERIKNGLLKHAEHLTCII